jgi:uncharacterized protein involved in response to NO
VAGEIGQAEKGFKIFMLFDLGFRPFFILAGTSAILLIVSWLTYFNGMSGYASYYGAYPWHSHEMIFGYTMAVIAGFLLTAVRSWTGIETVRHSKLAGLVGLWILGRLFPFFYGGIPNWLIAVVDLSFLPAIIIAIGIPLIKSNNQRNFFFIPVFILFVICNSVFHLTALGHLDETYKLFGLPVVSVAVNFSLGLVMLIITVIGGRVIPLFTQSALTSYKARTNRWVEYLSIFSVLIFVIVFSFVNVNPVLQCITASFAAVINLLRLSTWYSNSIWRHPLVWILHVSYAWLVLAYGLFALETFFVMVGKPALHALTVGTIGGLTLGMMVRVSLGHTGRPLQVSGYMTVAFVILSLAALIRVFLPMLVPQYYSAAITLSGLLWVCAFAAFLFKCTPILIAPRADGQAS